MVHPGLVALVLLSGCRIGFDPIAGDGPDAGTDAALAIPHGGCTAGIPCAVIADSGAIVSVTCAPDQDCLVECTLAAACDVHCNDASTCVVSCPAAGCSVHECGSTCDVGCGSASVPSRSGATATCP